jgi:hypothetical protein
LLHGSVRYKLGSGRAGGKVVTPYENASPEKKRELERQAVVANIVTGNKRKVCEARGIPLDIFTGIWEEYRETNMFNGRFFHRLGVQRKTEKDGVKRMRLAIEEYYANGGKAQSAMNTAILICHAMLAVVRGLSVCEDFASS